MHDEFLLQNSQNILSNPAQSLYQYMELAIDIATANVLAKTRRRPPRQKKPSDMDKQRRGVVDEQISTEIIWCSNWATVINLRSIVAEQEHSPQSEIEQTVEPCHWHCQVVSWSKTLRRMTNSPLSSLHVVSWLRECTPYFVLSLRWSLLITCHLSL
ncbi:hypothetical protein JG687_00017131 [Phytophthora cactorum]|uniref:Uncharacterized protein n=1 Tax=Phytophthora cactorum TaxID=29920 RepID=A0A8T1TU12_9STRA|nr:hypothetical protein JG687_00017131 [Phytophthora cactorum]